MDWSNWKEIRDQSFPSCQFDYEPEIKYGGTNWKHDFSFEERSLNEKACDQVRRILLGKENVELLKLGDDVTTLEKQLAWADVSWSELDSVPLSERVKSLDLSIGNFKVTNLGDDRVFGECSFAYRGLEERWMRILKLLPEKYLDQKTIQVTGQVSEPLSSDVSRANDESGKDKKVIEGKKGDLSEKKKTNPFLDIQMNESDPLLDFINQKREQLAKRNPKEQMKTEKLKAKKVLNQTVRVEYNLSDPQNQSDELKSQSQNLPNIEEEKKLKSLNHNLTRSSNMKSLENISFSSTDARMEETPKVLPLSASSDLLLKSEKPKAKKVLNQNVNLEYNFSDPNQSALLQKRSLASPDIEKEEKKFKGLNYNPIQSSPNIEKEEKKFKGLNYNPIQSSSVEKSLQTIKFSVTNARMKEAPKVLFSSRVTPGRVDFNLWKMTDLRIMAKSMNLKGLWKLSKAELIEELNSKLANRGN